MREPFTSSQYTPQYVIPGDWPGLLKTGNVDLNSRPLVRNPDGSFSTVKSISFGVGGHEVLVPQVVGDRVVSPEAALHNYLTTGEHLGIFTNPQSANQYAVALHNQQAQAYGSAASAINSAKGALVSHGG